MRFHKVIIPAALLSGLIALSGSTSLVLAATPVHRVCADCHKLPKEMRTTNVNELCLSCHPAGDRRDHALGIVQGRMSSSLPLDKDKRMTCLTCHDPHGKGSGPKLMRMEKTKLCQDCHKK